MKYVTGKYANTKNVQLITDLLDIVQPNIDHNQYLDLLKELENLISMNEFVQTLVSPTSDNVLIIISDKNPNKTLDSIIETNIDINTYLHPSEHIEEPLEDFWYYYEENILILKYDLYVLNQFVYLGEK